MIRLSKDRVLEDFFIDDNGIITNKEGEVQKIYYSGKRPYFKSVKVYQIQMWTKYGWRDGKIWAIHHIDENPLNNSINNLVFMTRREHMKLHKTGKKLSKESKRKISETLKERNLSQPMSDEIRNKISDTMKRKQIGKKWFNDGVYAYFIHPEEALPHYQKGMLKRCKK